MANDQNDYHSFIASMRRDRQQREVQQRFTEIEEAYVQETEARDSAARQQDIDGFNYHDSEAERLEAEHAKLQAEHRPPPQLTPEQEEWLRPRVGEMHKPHWSGAFRPDGRPATNWDATLYGHKRALAEGHQPGSPQYIAYLDALSPREQDNTILSADEALEICRNSEYGKDLDAKTYNHNVREGHKAGLLGQKDR